MKVIGIAHKCKYAMPVLAIIEELIELTIIVILNHSPESGKILLILQCMKHAIAFILSATAILAGCTKEESILGDWTFERTEYYFNGESAYTSTAPYYAAEFNFANEANCVVTDKSGNSTATPYVFDNAKGTVTIGENTYQVKEKSAHRLVLGKDFTPSSAAGITVEKLQEVYGEYYENEDVVPETGLFAATVAYPTGMISVLHQIFYQNGEIVYVYNGFPCYVKDGELHQCGLIPESEAKVTIHKEVDDIVTGHSEYEVSHAIVYETAEIIFRK